MDDVLSRTNQTSTVFPETTQAVHVADADFNKPTRLVVLYVEIVVGTLGGLLVCVWLWENRGRKCRVNIIISHLALADLLVISFACVMQVGTTIALHGIEDKAT